MTIGTLVVATACMWPVEASLLDNDSWAVRQAAERRIASKGVLGYPSAILASLGTPEQRHRAKRLLPLEGVVDDIADHLLAAWLFYGPDQVKDKGGVSRRCLSDANNAWCESMPSARMLRLVAIARKWGLVRPNEIMSCEAKARGWAGYTNAGWIDAIRWRAVGNPKLGSLLGNADRKTVMVRNRWGGVSRLPVEEDLPRKPAPAAPRDPLGPTQKNGPPRLGDSLGQCPQGTGQGVRSMG